MKNIQVLTPAELFVVEGGAWPRRVESGVNIKADLKVDSYFLDSLKGAANDAWAALKGVGHSIGCLIFC